MSRPIPRTRAAKGAAHANLGDGAGSKTQKVDITKVSDLAAASNLSISALFDGLVEQIAALVAANVQITASPTGRRLVDIRGLCEAVDASPTTIWRMVKEGMPRFLLGDSSRFDIDECIAWMRERALAKKAAK